MTVEITSDMTIDDFIEALQITLTYEDAPENPHMQDKGRESFNFFCTLKCGESGREMTCYHSKGFGHVELLTKLINRPITDRKRKLFNIPSGSVAYDPKYEDIVIRQGRYGWTAKQVGVRWRKKPPHVGEVLDCLAQDASGVENARSFDEWCGEYGYDTDSRSALRTYEICREQARELERLLGREHYRMLLWEIGR